LFFLKNYRFIIAQNPPDCKRFLKKKIIFFVLQRNLEKAVAFLEKTTVFSQKAIDERGKIRYNDGWKI
jgi:hypothetical protein